MTIAYTLCLVLIVVIMGKRPNLRLRQLRGSIEGHMRRACKSLIVYTGNELQYIPHVVAKRNHAVLLIKDFLSFSLGLNPLASKSPAT